MKVKVCGLKSPDNIKEILELGVDYIGMIFYAKSPRFAESPELMNWLRQHEAAFENTRKVGVFVNAEIEYILNTVHDYQLDFVQLHGNESAGYCRELKLLWSVNTLRKASIIKAFSVDEGFDFRSTNEYADSCPLFIFDTGGHAAVGGTGQQWDWDKLAEYDSPVPFLLSGGIGLEDADAIRRLDHPQLRGVDVNSKFEVSPGQKDVTRLRLFLRELKA
ncbi:phosphoribosylanthranilate isomerase [Lewinella sp. W8]|uniref:phosphoribosylanthranilate isomerase n=1 Tax=Lewinella sp. W8 TaxID=2528208 RepID=UPI00106772CC|nr:phosphoribosylanthranilate isomerase [Lewinella sp. W8]MTB51348.1 phosphoribosylanthranilate isomerase [Lewinella sp. W8]